MNLKNRSFWGFIREEKTNVFWSVSINVKLGEEGGVVGAQFFRTKFLPLFFGGSP